MASIRVWPWFKVQTCSESRISLSRLRFPQMFATVAHKLVLLLQSGATSVLHRLDESVERHL